MNQNSGLVFEIDGTPWESTISFDPRISVVLAGDLTLAAVPGVDSSPLIGSTLQLFNWNGVTPSGQFTTVDDLGSSYLADTSKLYTTGNVTILGHAAPNLTVTSGNNQRVMLGVVGVTAALSLSNGTAGQAGLASLDVDSLGSGVSGPAGAALVPSGSTQAYTASLNTERKARKSRPFRSTRATTTRW